MRVGLAPSVGARGSDHRKDSVIMSKTKMKCGDCGKPYRATRASQLFCEDCERKRRRLTEKRFHAGFPLDEYGAG